MANKSPKGYIKVKAEYELVYADKEPKASILTNTLEAPLQEVRIFNEDTPWDDGWQNMLIFGDNLLALKTLYEDVKPSGSNKYKLRNKIKLIYIDPPFATKQDFMKDKEKAYADKVKGAKFIEFLRKRLIFLREILADDGVIWLHIDYKKGHYIKAILDEVFGETNFLNEIIWKRVSTHNDGKQYGKIHDNIYLYAKSENYIFNKQLRFVNEKYIEKKYPKIDEKGQRYFPGNLSAAGHGPALYFNGKLIAPPTGTHWRYKQVNLDQKIDEGKIEFSKNGKPSLRIYYNPETSFQVQDIWEDLLMGQGVKLTEYPTEKPEKLLQRIINTATKKGDVILDCFIGSGSTAVVAEKLGRKWIGIDVGKLAIYTSQMRLIRLDKRIAGAKDERTQLERIEYKKEIESTRGMFFISEKAKKGQLDLTDDFICRLHELLKDIKGIDEFSLVCPEDKFFLSKFDEDEENGFKTFKKEHITYKISFIEPKNKQQKSEPLRAKSFVLYNAGVYDKENILNLHWEQYKEFVAKLFEVRKYPHDINGFNIDGYIGTYSAYIWNYPERKNIAIDEEYVIDLHRYLKGKAGDRFYVIAPGQSINFMQDEIKVGETVYTFLKVPVSVLIRLIQSGELSSFKQPKSEDNINEVIDAFGFDFISQPQLKYTLHKQKQKLGMFEEEKFLIKLTEFYSDGLLYSPGDFKNFETLSLILVDFDYKDEPFTMDTHFWAKDLVTENATEVEIVLDAEKWEKNKLAVIFIDDYGNEKKLVLDKKDFK